MSHAASIDTARRARSFLPRAGRRFLLRSALLAVLAIVLAAPPLAATPPAKPRSKTGATGAKRRTPRPLPLVWHVETVGGEILDSNRGDEPINPASVVKVATTLWALERLGPEHRFNTRFLTNGALSADKRELVGDLLVAGGADPDFQYENALLVARELNELGIRRVRGDLVVSYEFWIGWEGGSGRVDSDPARRAQLMGARLRQAFEPKRWNGSIRRAWTEVALRHGFDAARPPALQITGRTRTAPDVEGRLLVRHHSRPLIETLHRLNAYSNNDIERLDATLGPPGEMNRWFKERWGAAADGVRFSTSSGLGENRLSPRQVVALLRDLRLLAKERGVTVEDVLPTAGCDQGTVTRFFQRISNGAATASVVGKTGTLTATDGGISVFAGFVSTNRGELIVCVAAPRAAGRLKTARSKEEQWLLNLLDQYGGPQTRRCGTPLAHPAEGALVEADPSLPRPQPVAANRTTGSGAAGSAASAGARQTTPSRSPAR